MLNLFSLKVTKAICLEIAKVSLLKGLRLLGNSCAHSRCEEAKSQLPKRVKNEKKFTGAKIGAIFCKITSRITTKKLKIGP